MSTTKNLSHILDEEDDLIPKSARRVAAVPVGASVEEKSAAARAVGELHSFDLSKYGISRPKHVFRNPSVAAMYEIALRKEAGTRIASSGALIAYSGEKTGRSPKDKRIVDTPAEHDDVFWESSACIPLSEHSFAVNKERAIDYLNCCCDHVFVIDAFAGWEADTRIKVRVISALAYHALFMHTMLVRPTEQELTEFGEPDVVIFNAGAFPANRLTDGMTSKTSIDLNLKTMEVVVLNSKYAGENKKSILSVMMYVALKRGHLPLHSSANMGRAEGDVTLFFGLSGTGKTTLSADPRRRLIGDDEHVWAERGVYNIEGGCYAKCDHLTREQEPEIYDAIRFGSVLENVVYDPITHVVDFDDLSVTENTRVAYPINYIPDAVIPCVGPHPRNIILLTCDAFGVLPPVSLLTPEQVQYQFISGYTAKVAGTEVGVTEPTATFSACFGEAFLVCHPGRYARVLAEKMQRHGGRAWLVNTGWSGGAYGVGQRMKLRLTRAIIDAIHDGTLAEAEMQTMPVFGLRVPTKCAGVPDEVLLPRNAWADKEAYDRTLLKVGALFIRNFEKYARGVAPEILAAGPQVDAATVAQLVPPSKGKEAVAG